jgi:hypothetical protein
MSCQPNRYERFWEKVDLDNPDGCWEWFGANSGDKWGAYGHMWVDGRHQRAHRLSYEWYVGPIPEGLQLDHLCRNHSCVRWDHLEPVTNAENGKRGWAARKGR